MFVTFGNAIYFRANDRTHGVELWRTDGTAEGTTLVADLFPGPSNGVPGSLTVAADGLFFHGFTEPTA
jgi:ELWxxDGT repeat protein